MADDFEKLDKLLEDIVKKMPGKKKELIENAGNILSEQIKKNIDHRVDDKNNRLKDDVKVVYGSKGGYVAVRPEYKNTRANHLIENGHRIVKKGVVIGFVNGKHMYRDSVVQCEGEILKMAEKMIDEVVKE